MRNEVHIQNLPTYQKLMMKGNSQSEKLLLRGEIETWGIPFKGTVIKSYLEIIKRILSRKIGSVKTQGCKLGVEPTTPALHFTADPELPGLPHFAPLNFELVRLPWSCSGWESACQCRGHGFKPWSRGIPHAAEQLGPCATTAEPGLWSL